MTLLLFVLPWFDYALLVCFLALCIHGYVVNVSALGMFCLFADVDLFIVFSVCYMYV